MEEEEHTSRIGYHNKHEKNLDGYCDDDGDDADGTAVRIPSFFSVPLWQTTAQQHQRRRKNHYDAVWYQRDDDRNNHKDRHNKNFVIGCIADKQRCHIIMIQMDNINNTSTKSSDQQQQQQEIVLQFPDSDPIQALCFVHDSLQTSETAATTPSLLILTQSGQLLHSNLDHLAKQALLVGESKGVQSPQPRQRITLESFQVMSLLLSITTTTANDSSSSQQLLQGMTQSQLVPCQEMPGWVLVGGNTSSGSRLLLVQLSSSACASSTTSKQGGITTTMKCKELSEQGDTITNTPSSILESMACVGHSKLDREFGLSLQGRLWSATKTANSNVWNSNASSTSATAAAASSTKTDDTNAVSLLRAVVFLGFSDGTLWASGIYDAQENSNNNQMHLIGWLSRKQQPISEIIMTSTKNHQKEVVDGLVCLGTQGDVVYMSSSGTMTDLQPLSGPGPWVSGFLIWPSICSNSPSTIHQQTDDGIMIWATNQNTGATYLHYWSQRRNGLGVRIVTDRPLPIRSDLEWTLPIRGTNGDYRHQSAPYFMGLTQEGSIVGFEVPCNEYSLEDWLCSPNDSKPRGTLRQSAQRCRESKMDAHDRIKDTCQKRLRKYMQHSSDLYSMHHNNRETAKFADSGAQMDKTTKTTLALLSAQQDVADGKSFAIQGGIENIRGNRTAAVQLQRRSHSTSALPADLDTILHVCEVPEASIACGLRDATADGKDAAIKYGGVAFSAIVPAPSTSRDNSTHVHRFVLPGTGEHSTATSYMSLTPFYSAMGCQRTIGTLVSAQEDDFADQGWPNRVSQTHQSSLGSMVVAEKLLENEAVKPKGV